MTTTDAPRPISRPQVIKRLLQLHTAPRYLEVGVSEGVTFHRLETEAATMVAVDPVFAFDHVEAAAQRPHATYHQVTSDEYFATLVGEDELFDVIYLDGLHTFEQTLRDLTNALAHLAPRGVIVIDDVCPPSYHASLPDHRTAVRVRHFVGETNKSWMGDVYRLLWFIDTFYPSLTCRVIANNHGQAVVWRQRRGEVVERGVREVAELSFQDYAMAQDVVDRRPFAKIRAEVAAMVSPTDWGATVP